MAPKVLAVRLGALGDLVHALPALAAMRHAWPDATIDWLVDARYSTLLRFATGYSRAIVIGGHASASSAGASAEGPGVHLAFPGAGSLFSAVRFLRAQHYDAALDLQGLIKS